MRAARGFALGLRDRRARLVESADGRRAVVEPRQIGEAIDAKLQRREHVAGGKTPAHVVVMPDRASAAVCVAHLDLVDGMAAVVAIGTSGLRAFVVKGPGLLKRVCGERALNGRVA